MNRDHDARASLALASGIVAVGLALAVAVAQAMPDLESETAMRNLATNEALLKGVSDVLAQNELELAQINRVLEGK